LKEVSISAQHLGSLNRRVLGRRLLIVVQLNEFLRVQNAQDTRPPSLAPEQNPCRSKEVGQSEAADAQL
jgi:hypothetical protein